MEHHVYFWLKDENKNAADRASFEAGLAMLLTLPGIEGGMWGKPAPTEPRPVVDQSWDYGLSMRFASIEAEAAYQQDPDHLEFITAHKDKWAQVKVMDLV